MKDFASELAITQAYEQARLAIDRLDEARRATGHHRSDAIRLALIALSAAMQEAAISLEICGVD